MGCAASCSLNGEYHREKIMSLSATPFCTSLTKNEIGILARHFHFKHFPMGARIDFGGPDADDMDAADQFFVLVEGTLNLYLVKDGEPPNLLCTKAPGDFIGETTEHNKNHHHSSTEHAHMTMRIDCLEKCDMLVMSVKQYNKFLNSSAVPSGLPEKVKNKMGQNMMDSLKKINLFNMVPEDEMFIVSNLFSYLLLKNNQTLFEEGSHGTEFYIVAEGSVGVYHKDSSGNQVRLEKKDITTGMYFGEIALMMDMPRTATITATDDTLLLKLKKEDFQNFLKGQPELQRGFNKIVKARTVNMFKKFDIPFLKDIEDDRMEELAKMSRLLEYAPNDVVFMEGEEGHAFYMVLHGILECVKTIEGSDDEQNSDTTKNKHVATLGAGKYFGEISLVKLKRLRSASIICKERSLLLSISREDFNEFFKGEPKAYSEFALRISRHDVPLVHVLKHPYGLANFAKHLELEFSKENLKFYQAVQDYKSLWTANATRDAIRNKAIGITSSFIKECGDNQVNLPGLRRSMVISRIERDMAEIEKCEDLFDSALDEVMKLMSSDSFSRFKRSELFEDLLREVGCFAPPQTPTPSLKRRSGDATYTADVILKECGGSPSLVKPPKQQDKPPMKLKRGMSTTGLLRIQKCEPELPPTDTESTTTIT